LAATEPIRMIGGCLGSTFFVALAWAQECEHIEDAFVLEHKIKGWRREKKLALIKGRYSDLPRLSHSGSPELGEGALHER
jgi:hypothetical protein